VTGKTSRPYDPTDDLNARITDLVVMVNALRLLLEPLGISFEKFEAARLEVARVVQARQEARVTESLQAAELAALRRWLEGYAGPRQ
jgi:hypothetical protein